MNANAPGSVRNLPRARARANERLRRSARTPWATGTRLAHTCQPVAAAGRDARWPPAKSSCDRSNIRPPFQERRPLPVQNFYILTRRLCLGACINNSGAGIYHQKKACHAIKKTGAPHSRSQPSRKLADLNAPRDPWNSATRPARRGRSRRAPLLCANRRAPAAGAASGVRISISMAYIGPILRELGIIPYYGHIYA